MSNNELRRITREKLEEIAAETVKAKLLKEELLEQSRRLEAAMAVKELSELYTAAKEEKAQRSAEVTHESEIQRLVELASRDSGRVTADKIRAESITADRIYARGGYSPADQHLISSLENGHVTVDEFQRRHGLPVTGVMDIQTREYISDLAYRRANDRELSRYIDQYAGKKRRHACDAQVTIYTYDGRTYTFGCDKGGNHDIVPHGATYVWYSGRSTTPRRERVRWDGHHRAYMREYEPGKFRPTTERSIAMPIPANVITRPKEFVKVTQDQKDIASAVSKAVRPTPDVSKVMVREGESGSDKYANRIAAHKAKIKGVRMTRELYRARFSEMEYSVVKAVHFGFRVFVSMANGGTWQYWRPTRPMAERTGTKRLKRELSKLDLWFERDNPTGVKARDIGVHFKMTPEELTAELAKDETERRAREQAEWDAQFNGESKAS